MTKSRLLVVLFTVLFIAAAAIIASSALSDKAPKSYNGATLVYREQLSHEYPI